MKCTVRTRKELEQAIKERFDYIVVADPALAKRVMRVKRLVDRLRIAGAVVFGITVLVIILVPVVGSTGSGIPLGTALAIVPSAVAGNPIINAIVVVAVAAFATIGIVIVVAIYRDYEVEMFGPLGARKVLMTRKGLNPPR